MPYIVFCQDSDKAPDLRTQYKQAHFTYIEDNLHKICVAGPMYDPATQQFQGSCFIYHTDDLAEAEELLFEDPYYTCGIYRQCDFSRFVAAAGTWIGGTVWQK